MFKEELLGRADQIGQSLARREGALAFLGLGSVGVETARIDDYSDLDLWAIVQPGYRDRFLNDQSWIAEVYPIAYCYKHGASGHTILFADEMLAEIDVFEQADLPNMDFNNARIIWKAPGVDDAIGVAQKVHHSSQRSLDELLGEALSNLFVGLGRYYRGEKLTAMRFIQVYAIDRILEMVPLIAQAGAATRDIYGNERRFEARYPVLAAALPSLLQGYERTPESAAAILAFLDRHFTINAPMKAAIQRRLAARPDQPTP